MHTDAMKIQLLLLSSAILSLQASASKIKQTWSKGKEIRNGGKPIEKVLENLNLKTLVKQNYPGKYEWKYEILIKRLQITKKETGASGRSSSREKRSGQRVSETSSKIADPRKSDCHRDLSCKGKCKSSPSHLLKKEFVCYCDEVCERFVDCCADYEHFCKLNATGNFVLTPSSDNLTTVGEYKRDAKSWGEWRCIQWKITKLGEYPSVWVIDKCVGNHVDSLALSKCSTTPEISEVTSVQELLDARPVYGDDGKVYKNRYCAMCNGLDERKVKPYGISLICDVKPPDTMSTEQKLDYLVTYCREGFAWEIPSESPRRYCLKLESCSDPCGKKCLNAQVGVVASGDVRNLRNYRNMYCNKEQFMICGPVSTGLPWEMPPTKSFSVIFDFKTNNDLPTINSKPDCKSDEVFDPYMETCSKRSVFLQTPPKVSSADKYRIVLWLSFCELDYQHADFANALGKSFGDEWDFTNIEATQSGSRATSDSKQWTLTFEAELMTQVDRSRRQSTGTADFDRVLHFTTPINITINHTECVVFKASKRILSCSDLRQYNKSEYTQLVTPTGAVYVNISDEVIHARDYYTNGTDASVGPIYVCYSSRVDLLNCSGVFFPVKHFVIFQNRSIFVNKSGGTYNASEYFVDNGTTHVCTEVRPRGEKIPDDTALAWLTFFCMLLSIATLVLFLVTYSLFSELRTIPGVNLMNLAVSILLAQVTWLTGVNQTDRTLACTVVAAMLQYFYLVSFMWTSIIAVDTWRAFSRKSHRGVPRSRREKCVRIGWLSALGWLPLMIFVLICVSLDQSGTVAIGYGSSTSCWMSNGNATLYVFAIPIALALVVNAIFYILTVNAIKAATQQARMAAENSQTRRHFGIYVRLAAVMGFTWVFGFGAVLLWSPLWYVFVSLNCLQGVYLAAAFALSDQARKHYRELLGIHKSQKTSQGRGGSYAQSVSVESRLERAGTSSESCM